MAPSGGWGGRYNWVGGGGPRGASGAGNDLLDMVVVSQVFTVHDVLSYIFVFYA